VMPGRPKVLAYYFPSWHRDPRNAEWFGEGWTEWELLRRARPRFPGHRQPRVPVLGHQDDSDPATFDVQIPLAVEFGVDGFLFDFYWYEDGPYLERALDHIEDQHEMRVVRLRSAFVFQRAAAPEQRRIFAGPFAPGRLVASRVLPVVPIPRGMRMQVVAAADLAAAYEAALVRPVEGAFNIATDPVLGSQELGELLGARIVAVPPRLARQALAAAFHARLAPTEPGLLELFLSLPLMDTTRARTELGWAPKVDATVAVRELVDGIGRRAGAPTPPLVPDRAGRG